MRKNINTAFVTLALATMTIFFFAFGAQAEEMGMVDTSKPQVEKIQHFIDQLMQENKNIAEINIHATGNDGDTKVIASTTSSRIGSQSDPEDIDAIIDNKVVLITEGDVLDVTIPMTNKKGLPAAVAGIRLHMKNGLNKSGAKAKALDIAKKINAILVTK